MNVSFNKIKLIKTVNILKTDVKKKYCYRIERI